MLMTSYAVVVAMHMLSFIFVIAVPSGIDGKSTV